MINSLMKRIVWSENMQAVNVYIQQFLAYLHVEKNSSEYTIYFYETDLSTFSNFLEREGITSLDDVNSFTVRVFLTELYDRKLSRRSVSRTISCLRSFYVYLEKDKIVTSNPFLHITLPKQDVNIPNFFYEEELTQLFEVSDVTTAIGQRNQALIEILYATGIRVSECEQLKLRQIDFSVQVLSVIGKGRKERFIPFGQYASEALKRYINEGRNELLSKSTAGVTENLFLNSRGKPITARGIRYVLNQMIKQTSLTVNMHPHKIRHSFATHMLNEGADLRSVQELLGHDNLSSTQIYTHVTKDRLRNVYMNTHPRARPDE